ncbi:MAG: hypothetical protein PHY02_02700 [Phycisphaerae bacterium]|nr:hypothetical protein [Phycisphaerae bacterium]
MNESEQTKVEGKGSRSPNYPAVSLKKSVEQVGQLYDIHKTRIVPIKMVHELWGYKAHSSVGDQCIAAAKAFGLIEITGKGKLRKVCVSSQGHRIHMKAPDCEDLLKKAALSPAIYSEIWEHYQADLPNDELLKNHLVWERQPRFNEKYVDRFIALFRESISFANLASGDIIKEDETKNDTPEDINIDDNKPKEGISMPPKTGTFDLPIPLLDGLSAFLRIPRPISEENYLHLVNFLKAIKPSIVSKSKQDETQEKTDETGGGDDVGVNEEK